MKACLQAFLCALVNRHAADIKLTKKLYDCVLIKHPVFVSTVNSILHSTHGIFTTNLVLGEPRQTFYEKMMILPALEIWYIRQKIFN